MTRRMIIYPIILLNLFLLIIATNILGELSRLPELVEVSLSYRPTTLLALAGTLSLAGFFVGIRALSRDDPEITEKLFP